MISLYLKAALVFMTKLMNMMVDVFHIIIIILYGIVLILMIELGLL